MNDPIDMYLPQLKDLQVYVSGEGDNMVTEKQKQPIRIIDLFMHTAGLSYGFSQSPVDKLYQQMFATANFKTADEMLDAIAKLPLNHQPGEKWHYGVNTDIIGFLVEKLSGKKLGEYMQEVIFEPLKMNDTGFYVTADKRDRLKQIYTVGDKGQTVVRPVGALGDYQSDPQVHNGGGGLVSTMDDYLTFAQMLLNGGEVNGTRILGRKTVEYMRTNHMPKHLVPFEPGAAGEGYGLAVSVTVDEGQLKFMGSEGNFGWGGMASTYVRIDPKENMIILGMSQFVPIGFHRYHDDLRNLVYQALVD
jgi:CubicO group peptidase (beta-lactamase class C family)